MRIIVLCLLMVGGVFANPTVSNIRVSQRENTKLVDILYDVSFIGGDAVSVGCEVSTNAGVSFDIPVTNFSGNGYGAIVSNGTDRLIVWNAGIDWDENYSEQMKIRITAAPPRFVDNGDDTVTDNKTGLMWQKRAYPTRVDFDAAVEKASEYGEGWRIPRFVELEALADAPTASGLPQGHPFIINSGAYWSADAGKFIYGMYSDFYYSLMKGFSFCGDGSDVAGNTSTRESRVPYVKVPEMDSIFLMAVKELN